MNDPLLLSPAAQHVWLERYRLRIHGRFAEDSPADTFARVARALASREADPQGRFKEFLAVLQDYRFLPAGRILAGAGTATEATLFSCFSMGSVGGSVAGMLDALKETALTLDAGGGAGIDFSQVRPAGQRELEGCGVSGGPVSALRLWESAANELALGGCRRAAMMGTLRVDHPDIGAFIGAKQDRAALQHFNLSVLATDAFMRAVELGEDWPLVFPASHVDAPVPGRLHEREWCGWGRSVSCREHRSLPARELFHSILKSAFDCAEPGLMFIDRMQQQNNLGYAERIAGTNPCGEIPLPAHGACNLGSLNLPRFVRSAFEPGASIDFAALSAVTETAVRMLDNVYEISGFPLPVQAETARRSRRLGIGVTGLADALVMLGAAYDSERGVTIAAEIMRHVAHAAYEASVRLAEERGPFPLFVRDAYLAAPFVSALPQTIRDGIARYGIRNSHLLAIAPAGSISLLANAVSSGIEPIHAERYERRIGARDGHAKVFAVDAYALRLWRAAGGEGTPKALHSAERISPDAHLAMQAALQPYVDNSISKTIALPEDQSFEHFVHFMRRIHASGIKGCTVFRSHSRPAQVMALPPSAEGCRQRDSAEACG
jgi:ribonucleoside-diphosphate reductase alpha chain